MTLRHTQIVKYLYILRANEAFTTSPKNTQHVLPCMRPLRYIGMWVQKDLPQPTLNLELAEIENTAC